MSLGNVSYILFSNSQALCNVYVSQSVRARMLKSRNRKHKNGNETIRVTRRVLLQTLKDCILHEQLKIYSSHMH